MEHTPERPSLECFSSIRSSSHANISDLPFFLDSPEIQKSRDFGFSSSILLNLAEEPKPASKLISLTELRPGRTPRKLLLPLFFQEPTQHKNRLRRSHSADIPTVPFNPPLKEEKKIITATTINTLSNIDIIEISPELFEKHQFEYEKEIRCAGFDKNPSFIRCGGCGSSAVTVVERERSGKLARKLKKILCCFGFSEGDSYVHKCSICKAELFRFNA